MGGQVRLTLTGIFQLIRRREQSKNFRQELTSKAGIQTTQILAMEISLNHVCVELQLLLALATTLFLMIWKE